MQKQVMKAWQMPVYTVHEPPVRTPGALADPARFAFVRDGFYWWAFLLTPLWMLWRRLWLVLVLYLVVSIGIETAMRIFGASGGMISLVAVLISLFVGLEAGTLQRFTLQAPRLEKCRRRQRQRSRRRRASVFRGLGRNVPPQPSPPPSAPPTATLPTTPWRRIWRCQGRRRGTRPIRPA